MQKSQLSQLGLTKKSVESPISSFWKEENENTTDFGGHTLAVEIGSSAEAGSSISRTEGDTAMARAMHNRCC